MRWAKLRRYGRHMTVLTALALLAGCAMPFGASAPPHPVARSAPPIATPSPSFATFFDWRVAYISVDGRLHLVALDGKTDLAGPLFTLVNDGQGAGAWTAGTAPNGRRLAVGSTADVHYIDLSATRVAQFQTFQIPIALSNGLLYWSPDGSHLAIDGGFGNIAILTLATGVARRIHVLGPATSNAEPIVGPVFGWLDDRHLAVEYLPDEYPNVPPSQMGTPQIAANLDSLNISTGALSHIATVRSSTLVQGQFSLEPDGGVALFSNRESRGFPFAPMADRIDVATGAITPLPHIARLISRIDTFLQVLWIPHTHQALVVVGPDEVSQASYDVIDLDRDSVTPVNLLAYPVAWSPDGKTLVLAASPASSKFDSSDGEGGPQPNGFGPFSLTAITFGTSWKVTGSVTLTSRAMQIPMLGFVHNP